MLDAYTVRDRFGDIRGLKVLIVGDVAHSRVARSNLWCMTALGAEVMICGPPTLLPAGLSDRCRGEAGLASALPPVTIEHDLDRAIMGADVVMALRLQHERQETGLLPSLREYARLYQVTAKRLDRASANAMVLHPGPVNEGVEIAVDVAHGARSLIDQQVTNGVAVRMALLYLLVRGAKPE
jgi:aspartate carbamoyltransferase catalytic subunit